LEVGFVEDGCSEVGSLEVGFKEVGSLEAGFVEVGSLEVGSPKVKVYYAVLFGYAILLAPLENVQDRLDICPRWPSDISDEDVLKNLLALNLERSERGAAENTLAGA
jgi:hypothetical protein